MLCQVKSSVDHLDQKQARAAVQAIPASSPCIKNYRAAQAEDTVCNTLISCCTNGWPDKHSLSFHIKPYWELQGDLSQAENLLL